MEVMAARDSHRLGKTLPAPRRQAMIREAGRDSPLCHWGGTEKQFLFGAGSVN
jgi:hypothetical protein